MAEGDWSPAVEYAVVALYRAVGDHGRWSEAIEAMARAVNAESGRLNVAGLAATWSQPGVDAEACAQVIRIDAGPGAELQLARRAERGPFKGPEAGAAAEIAPHLRRALAQAKAPAPRGESVAEALDLFSTPCWGVDAAGTVLLANRAARRLKRGDVLWVQDDQLIPRDGEVEARLSRAIAEAAGPGRRPAEVTVAAVAGSADGGCISVAPLSLGAGRALVFLAAAAPMEADAGVVERLGGVFGLTRAEAEIAIALICGGDAKDIARQRAVSVETVRSQVKSILSKTQSSRQAELFRLRGLLGP